MILTSDLLLDSSVVVAPLSGVVGAEVSGLDLAQPLSDDSFAAVHDLFSRYHVLAFRGQELTAEQQIAFARRFGPLGKHPFVEGSKAHPEMLEIVTEPDDRHNFGGGWHTDVTFLEAPDLGSLLYAIEIPPYGGDTLFANQHAAYEALSGPMKAMLDPLTAWHSAEMQYGKGRYSTRSKAMKTTEEDPGSQVHVHPVIRTHPVTGEKALYVNPAFTTRIRELHNDESQQLLRYLFAHAAKEAFTCRVRWEVGTLVMWDNRSVQHHALYDYAGHRRHMRRVTVAGDIPR